MAVINPAFLSLPISELLALTVYGEAGGEGEEGMIAVMNVIRNRAREVKKYGTSSITQSPYHSVILKPWQFSMYNVSDRLYSKALEIAEDFYQAIEENPTLKKALDLSRDFLAGVYSDNTSGATHYHATSVLPSWANKIPLVARIGNHIFYSESTKKVTAVSATAIFTIGCLLLYFYFRHRS